MHGNLLDVGASADGRPLGTLYALAGMSVHTENPIATYAELVDD
jgi:hypothetical protein